MSWQFQFELSLAQFTLDVRLDTEHRRIALIGPNGSGKTSLLRTIVGANKPARGVIKVGSSVVFSTDPPRDLPCRSRRTGYVPQGFALFPHLTVLENVCFGQTAERLNPDQSERRAQQILTQLACAELSNMKPNQLSMGQQQRVALARALMISPLCLLLDEPLSALDPSARRRIRKMLAGYLSTENLPALIVTHDQRDVFALSEYVCVLDNGQIIQHGTPQSVSQRPANDFVAEFFDQPSA